MLKVNNWDVKEIGTTNSTNKEVRNMKNSTVLYTLDQKKGYGKNESIWISEKGDLCISIKFFNISNMDLLIPLSLIYSIKDFGYSGLIKWPNDIIINNKKCIGILFETEYVKNICINEIVGIGINIIEKNSIINYSYPLIRLKNNELLFLKLFLNYLDSLSILTRNELIDKVNQYVYMKYKEIEYNNKHYVIMGFDISGKLLLKEKYSNQFIKVKNSYFLNDYKSF